MRWCLKCFHDLLLNITNSKVFASFMVLLPNYKNPKSMVLPWLFWSWNTYTFNPRMPSESRLIHGYVPAYKYIEEWTLEKSDQYCKSSQRKDKQSILKYQKQNYSKILEITIAMWKLLNFSDLKKYPSRETVLLIIYLKLQKPHL